MALQHSVGNVNEIERGNYTDNVIEMKQQGMKIKNNGDGVAPYASVEL